MRRTESEDWLQDDYNVIVIQTVWYCWKIRQINETVEGLEVDSPESSKWIFDKGAKATECSKYTLQQMVLEQLDTHMKKN